MIDEVIEAIANYVDSYEIESEEALNTAALCLMDSLGCAILALEFPDCTKLLGPVVDGTIVPNGSRVPGTNFVLDPIKAAFDIGTMIRWLDYNDTWLAQEWGHPSDNLGGLLAVSDYLNRRESRLTVKDLLIAMTKAYEIQGGLALHNSFNRIGLDHVILVKIATAAVTTKLLGGNFNAIANAISNGWVDGGPLRAYRHAPNTGSRKSWAAGDQTSRGLSFAFMAIKGEMGYPQALTAKKWGFYDVLFNKNGFKLPKKLDSYVMENILFKIAFPAEFHGQTAAECAILLHPEVINRIEEIKEIKIETHESAIRIIDKKGPLNNSADRDHCLQYIVALGLLFGSIKAKDYESEVAADKRIDFLRQKMTVVEKEEFSCDYLDPEKRAIPNAITIFFQDGSSSERIEVLYPLGHRRRRAEALPLIFEKFQKNLLVRFNQEKVSEIIMLFKDKKRLNSLLVSELIDLFSVN